MRTKCEVLLIISAFFWTGCGGGGVSSGNINRLPEVIVVVNPTTAELTTTLQAPSTVQFSASVMNTSNQSVSWFVNDVLGGDASVGTISSTGLYTAPQKIPAKVIMVAAVPAADPAKRSTASVSLTWAVEIALSLPSGSTVPLSGRLPLDYAVNTFSDDKTLEWTVGGIVGGDELRGTITAGDPGRVWYNAPAAALDSAVVTATANANSRKTATVAVTLLDSPLIISPSLAVVRPGQQQQFSLLENGNPVAASWAINGYPGGTADTGWITDGTYAAPASIPALRRIVISATTAEGRFAAVQAQLVPDGTDSLSRPLGTFAFTYGEFWRGFIGTLTFDGDGHVTGIGDFVDRGFNTLYSDVRDSTPNLFNRSFTGAYSTTSNGDIYLKLLWPSSHWPDLVQEQLFHLAFVSDRFAYTAGGFLEKQDRATFSSSDLNSAYVIAMNGRYYLACGVPCNAPTDKGISAIGVLQADGAQGMSGVFDSIEHANGSDATSSGTYDGTYTVDSSGRGRWNGESLVLVSPEKFLFMLIPPVVGDYLAAGSAERQTPPFDGASLIGPYVAPGTTHRLVADGIGSVNNVLLGASESEFSGSYDVQSDGRGVIDIGSDNPQRLMFSMINPDALFIAGTSELNAVKAERQNSSPFPLSFITGTYFLSMRDMHGWFTRANDQDGYGLVESGSPAYAHAQYVKVRFLSLADTGVGMLEIAVGENAPKQLRYYAVSPAKLLLAGGGLAERIE